jgi:hypothetical protein
MNAIHTCAIVALSLSTACALEVEPQDVEDPRAGGETQWPAGTVQGDPIELPDGTCATAVTGDFKQFGAKRSFHTKWYDACGSEARASFVGSWKPDTQRGAGVVEGELITSEGMFPAIGRYRYDSSNPGRGTMVLEAYDGSDVVAVIAGMVSYEPTAPRPDWFEGTAVLY